MGDPMKYVKWRLSAFYSFHHHQLIPDGHDEPHPGILFGGQGYRWQEIFKNRDPYLFRSFVFSVLMSKKGMPRPGPLRLRKAEQATFDLLTTEPESRLLWQHISVPFRRLNSTQIATTPINISDLVGQLRRTVRELFNPLWSGRVYKKSDRILPFFPSTSANYINTRASGGAVGAIMDIPIYWLV